MTDYQSLSHTKWECKYHGVFIPKYRRKVLYGHLRPQLGEVLRELARQKESTIEERSMCSSMPGKSVMLRYENWQITRRSIMSRESAAGPFSAPHLGVPSLGRCLRLC